MADWKLADLLILGKNQDAPDSFPVFYTGRDRGDAMQRWLNDTKVETLAAALEFAVYLDPNRRFIGAKAQFVIGRTQEPSVTYPLNVNMTREERGQPHRAAGPLYDDVKLVAARFAADMIRLVQKELNDGYKENQTQVAGA